MEGSKIVEALSSVSEALVGEPEDALDDKESPLLQRVNTRQTWE